MYKLYIYNAAGAKLAYVKALFPLDGTRVLEFSDYISSYGELMFRVQTSDPLAEEGLFEPYKYHVKVYRYNALVWAGVITDNPHRNHKYIEVKAKTYGYLMGKVAVAHTSGKDYREFNSGTMSTAVTTVMNEGIARTDSPISDFTLSTIENPVYPWATDKGFTFTNDVYMRFEAASLLQVISSMADVANADWSVSNTKVFSFVKSMGGTKPNVVLKFGKGGNVSDYDSPLDGTNMTNDLYVASLDKATQGLGKPIHKEQEETSLYSEYKRLWSSILFNEELTQDMLNERAKKIMALNKTPDTQLSLMLNEKASPIGTYNLGDYIQVIINDGPISIQGEKRVIGWKVQYSSSGVERTTLYTNNRF